MINRKANEPTLKLQSYKIDNSLLASKINELNELKSQLQSSLSHHHRQQNSIYNQLHELKCQNQILRGQVSNLEFTVKKQNNSIEQLQFKLNEAEKKAQQFSKMYETGSKNIKELSIFYNKKMSAFIEDKQILKNLYQNKISTLYAHLQKIQNSKNYIAYTSQVNQSGQQLQGQLQQNSVRRGRKKLAELEGEKRTIILPQKYLTSEVILQKEEDSILSGQDIYLQMIQHVYKQLLKIQSKANDLLKIPQVQAFSQLRNPSKNDFAKLISTYPFHIRQNNKIELTFNFISKQLSKRNIPFAGRFIIKGIIQAIEKISNNNETKPHSFEIYSQNSNLNQKNGYYQSETLHQGRMEFDKILNIDDSGQRKVNIDLQASSLIQLNQYL